MANNKGGGGNRGRRWGGLGWSGGVGGKGRQLYLNNYKNMLKKSETAYFESSWIKKGLVSQVLESHQFPRQITWSYFKIFLEWDKFEDR